MFCTASGFDILLMIESRHSTQSWKILNITFSPLEAVILIVLSLSREILFRFRFSHLFLRNFFRLVWEFCFCTTRATMRKRRTILSMKTRLAKTRSHMSSSELTFFDQRQSGVQILSLIISQTILAFSLPQTSRSLIRIAATPCVIYCTVVVFTFLKNEIFNLVIPYLQCFKVTSRGLPVSFLVLVSQPMPKLTTSKSSKRMENAEKQK